MTVYSSENMNPNSSLSDSSLSSSSSNGSKAPHSGLGKAPLLQFTILGALIGAISCYCHVSYSAAPSIATYNGVVEDNSRSVDCHVTAAPLAGDDSTFGELQSEKKPSNKQIQSWKKAGWTDQQIQDYIAWNSSSDKDQKSQAVNPEPTTKGKQSSKGRSSKGRSSKGKKSSKSSADGVLAKLADKNVMVLFACGCFLFAILGFMLSSGTHGNPASTGSTCLTGPFGQFWERTGICVKTALILIGLGNAAAAVNQFVCTCCRSLGMIAQKEGALLSFREMDCKMFRSELFEPCSECGTQCSSPVAVLVADPVVDPVAEHRVLTCCEKLKIFGRFCFKMVLYPGWFAGVVGGGIAGQILRLGGACCKSVCKKKEPKKDEVDEVEPKAKEDEVDGPGPAPVV